MSDYHVKRVGNDFVLNCNEQLNIISQPWDLGLEHKSVRILEIENVLQFLTSMEADLAMLKYFDVLKIGGKINITVPNTDYFIALWQQATWNNSNLMRADSDARKAFAGLWGAQQQGNPRDDGYSPTNTGAFNSGYNPSRLTLLLERAGFLDISVKKDGAELNASATKTMNRGERQISTKYDQIRPDHLNRYKFACQQIGKLGPASQILDLACGIGYGTLMLANETGAQLSGVDIDKAGIEHAKQHFSNELTHFTCQNAKLLDIDSDSQDYVVSFETIEHVDFDQQLLNTFFKVLKPGGKLICSTPNQDVMPYDKERFAFHIKHYTNPESATLQSKSEFVNIELLAQHDPVARDVVEGQNRSFTIAVASKESA